MASMSDFFENRLIDGLLRGGCLTTAGAAGSTAVVKGIRTISTAYAVGEIVVPTSGDTAAGGKLLKCTTAGTSAASGNLAIPNPGATVADGTVTWTAIATVPALDQHYIGLFTANPTDTGGGTEVTGGSYARVAIASTLAAWNGTNGTTAVSSGATGTASNVASITFPAPTANWGVVTGMAIYDAPTGGNQLFWAALTTNKTVNNGDAAPVFSAAALTVQIDN